jgi:hypothetical protein
VPIEPDNRRGPDRRKHTRGGRRSTDIPLANPDACPTHDNAFETVLYTERYDGYRAIRHCCTACNLRWWSFDSRIDPAKVTFKI